MRRWRTEVEAWVASDPDENCRRELLDLLERGDDVELERRFSHRLTFGTAGLRGEVMAGPAGMNRLTVRRATQGVVRWLDGDHLNAHRGVVVGRDARHGSREFADEVVAVLVGAGVEVYELTQPLPTPFVPYSVRQLGAAAGIMITASHNPARDNGYKLYAGDGAQIIPPDDEAVERFAQAAPPHPPLGERTSAHYHAIDDALLERYRTHVLARFAPEGGSDLAITYTPLQGVGGETMRTLFARAGYRALTVVDQQFDPDPNFSTLAFPNPEEPGALDLATQRGDEVESDLVIANDPDADRLGVAVREGHHWRVLRGDEVGWLLASALLDEGVVGDEVFATTIVSSTLLEKLARDRGVHFVETLTGFKWIARAARTSRLTFGYEEALGYAVDALVADKDGLSSALALARLAHDLRAQGHTLLDRLDELETRYGVHATAQVSVRLNGLAASTAFVSRVRANPPRQFGGLAVREVADLASGWRGLPPTDGLLIYLADQGRVIVRPSGTEPKVKFYLELTAPPSAALARSRVATWDRLERVVADVRALAE